MMFLPSHPVAVFIVCMYCTICESAQCAVKFGYGYVMVSVWSESGLGVRIRFVSEICRLHVRNFENCTLAHDVRLTKRAQHKQIRDVIRIQNSPD